MAEARSRSSGTSSRRSGQSSARRGGGDQTAARGRSRNGDAASPSGQASRRGRQTSGAAASAGEQANAGGQGAIASVGKFAIKRVAIPVASAAIGAVAATALEQRRLGRRRKVLGIPLPRPRTVDFDGLAKNVGQAGRQFGRLADEVRQSREKAERVGKALS